MSRHSMLRVSDVGVAPTGGPSPEVVQGFSMTIEPGECVALTGANGSGKTTLALAVAGLRPIRSGAIEWMGRSIRAGADSSAREHVAIVLQEPECQLLQPTVADELAFSARNRGGSEREVAARVRRRARQLGLESDLERDPRSLSAGRQQLVLIAAALVQEPRLLVLDEAGAHLDPANRAKLIEVLAEDRRRGLSILWVTQEREELVAADRILTLGPDHSGAPPSDSIVPSNVAGRSGGGPQRAVLRIAPVSAESGPRVATIESLSIEVPLAGLVVVEGPNGCGKSVVLSAAAGALELPQIEVEWRARPEPPPLLASQYPELQIFEERAADEVVFAAVSRGLVAEEALGMAGRMLGRLGFDPVALLKRRSWELSAGEKRVLQVVGTLIAPSSLWILDEPTAGLGRTVREFLARELIRVADTGTCLLASQDGEWLNRLPARRIVLVPCESPRKASPGQKTD